MTNPLLEKFLRSVNKTDGCWLWVGPVGRLGLPRCRNFYKDGLPDSAVRVMWILNGNTLKGGEQLIHTCGNKLCVRLDHVKRVADALEIRFWARVDKNGPVPLHRKELGKCWIWTGAKSGGGYGCIGLSPNRIACHRYSFELHKGQIPDGLCALHRCDNPPCVNPEHLFAGTKGDNYRDCISKNRHSVGDRHGMAKIGWKDVQEIRRLRPETTLKALADRFGVTEQAVWMVVKNKNWKSQ